MVYAMFDSFVTKGNGGAGFANTKKVMAFDTIIELNEFLTERKDYDFLAKRISRKIAMKNLEKINGSDCGYGVEIYGYDVPCFVILKVGKHSNSSVGEII